MIALHFRTSLRRQNLSVLPTPQLSCTLGCEQVRTVAKLALFWKDYLYMC